MRYESFSDRDRQTVAITGSSGLIGTHLRHFLGDLGHSVIRVVRSPKETDTPQVQWTPTANEIEAERLEGVDAVVHLAGENIFGRWTERKKESILASRKEGTATIANAIASLDDPPRVFVSASAVGYYGDTGDEWQTESSEPGGGFLAEVCQLWEDATAPVRDSGVRTVNLRTGVALSEQGGALKTMRLPFQLGLGGWIGDGSQYMSWVHLKDLVGIIYHCLFDEQLQGPVNAVSPNPVTNYDFSKKLGEVLGRPVLFGIPGFAVRVMFGQMGTEMLLSGQRVWPSKLQDAGFEYHYADLERALREELG